MSPSEADLRAALRDGEDDDRLDAGRVIADARAHRGQRRGRVLSIAAAVVLVGAAAVGGGAVWRRSGGGQQSVAPSSTTRSELLTGPARVDPSSGATVAAGCPTAYRSRPARPTTQPNGAVKYFMFSGEVRAVVVCAYRNGDTPVHVVLTGAAASSLVASIEAAPQDRPSIMCPDIESRDKSQLAIIATTTRGTVLPAVTTDVSIPDCNQPITNGTAVRYNWRPPASLTAQLAALR